MKTKCTRCDRVEEQVVYNLNGKVLCYFCIDDMISDEEMEDFDQWVESVKSGDNDYNL